MAGATRREKHDWEAQMASVSLAGIRPLVMAHLNVVNGGVTVTSYTVSNNPLTKRVVVFHDATGNKEIYFDIDNDPTDDSMPIMPNMYFVIEVEQGEEIRFINTGGGTNHVHLTEIR
jgi:hypothetical protein